MKFLFAVFTAIFAVTVWATERHSPYTEQSNPEAYCLALNIYWEARGSSLADKAAVSDVVLNRVKSNSYPDSVCKVVYDARLAESGQPIRNQCQFSWYCDGKSDTPREADAWYEAQVIAYQIYHNDRFKGITEGADHYHSTKVDPYWAEGFDFVAIIGDHIFYRSN